MKILDIKVEWNEKWNNSPDLIVKVDQIPSVENLVFQQYARYYWAEKDGYILFYSYIQPSNGFGGRTFYLNMKDGTEKKLIGPWSGNSMGLRGVVECTGCYFDATKDSTAYFQGGCSLGHPAAIRIDILNQAIQEFETKIIMVKLLLNKTTKDWFYTPVTKDGRAKPFAEVDPMILEAIETGEPRYFDEPRKKEIRL